MNEYEFVPKQPNQKLGLEAENCDFWPESLAKYSDSLILKIGRATYWISNNLIWQCDRAETFI